VADDILSRSMILQSFCPTGGEIKSVTIYLSDFGKERLEDESKHGPRWLWDETLVKKKQASEEKDADGGDFVRASGHVGIVFDDNVDEEELDIIGREGTSDTDKKDKKKKKNASLPLGSDADQQKELHNVLLRKYELNKLRYYFAIAECSSVAVAESLYEQLDNVEMESSSMIFDLRFVPDDVSFEGREIKEQSNNQRADNRVSLEFYEAPASFVVSALQQSKLECSWDQDAERDRKLTNVSMWRKLKENDLMQYIASSDSSDDENSEDEDAMKNAVHDEGDSDDLKTSKSKSSKAKNMRKLLLGDLADEEDGSDASSGSNSGSDADEPDDFFLPDKNKSKHGSKYDGDDDDGFGERSMTFMPEDKDESDEDDDAGMGMDEDLVRQSP
jgi:hypothetical protein